MTHTLHRVGTEENLAQDFVILAMPSQNINHEGSGPKLQTIIRTCLDKGAIKVGDARLGNEYHQGDLETMINNIEDRAVVQAVFNSEETLIEALKAIKAADTGICIVVSGLFTRVDECCHQAGVVRHTTNQSLGRWGATDKLPPQEIMEIQSMCGHQMVTVSLIEDSVAQVKSGELTPEQAGERLFRPCQCGIFNPDRAAKIIKGLM